MSVLTGDQPERYDRQLLLPPIAIKGQDKIKQAPVLIAGAGELL
jgi:molybdopterin/thiamine biosynthesis adenylyltransferase